MRQYISNLKSVSRKLLEGRLFGLPKRSLEQGLSSQRPFALEIENQIVPLSFRKGRSDTLIISFHGAVNKAVRSPPVFAPHTKFTFPAPHQLSISDPTLLLPGEFGVAWYAGHEGFAAQAVILNIIQECVRLSKATQLIFIGGSAGGFAALYNSWHFPNSYAVVAAPQTNLDRYSLSRKAPYRNAVWPNLPPESPLSNVICANLCQLYDAPMTNNVVMLYSVGDRSHFNNHLLPFTAVISKHCSDRFVLECGYWGVEGHSGAVPPSLLTDWLRAIMQHPGMQVAKLIPALYDLRCKRNAVTRHNEGPDEEAVHNRAIMEDLPSSVPGPSSSFEKRDVDTANRLTSLLTDRD